MKRLLLIVAFIFAMTSLVHAGSQSYLIVEDATNEIYSLSDKDDAVMPETRYTKYVLDIKFKDILLQTRPSDYLWINENFVLNIQKISDRENGRITGQARKEELAIIDKMARKLAFLELQKDGYVFKYYTLSDFE